VRCSELDPGGARVVELGCLSSHVFGSARERELVEQSIRDEPPCRRSLSSVDQSSHLLDQAGRNVEGGRDRDDWKVERRFLSRAGVPPRVTSTTVTAPTTMRTWSLPTRDHHRDRSGFAVPPIFSSAATSPAKAATNAPCPDHQRHLGPDGV
jgi:hypothetical protein